MKFKQTLISIFCLSFIGQVYGMSQDLFKECPMSTLIRGVKENKIDLINNALGRGADINRSLGSDCTVLDIASHSGFEDIVKLLLIAKADPNREFVGMTATRNDIVLERETALMLASNKGSKNIVELLLNANADPSVKYLDETAIDIARKRRFNEIEEILKNAQERRRLIVKGNVSKASPLFNDLAEIVSEYVVCPKESKKVNL